MLKYWKRADGFTIIEIFLLVSIVAILMSMAILSFKNLHKSQMENHLRQNLHRLRQAVSEYYKDHRHYPCSGSDFNRNADPELFKKQLLWYTNEKGEPSQKRSQEFRFGPYLHQFPEEPITGSQQVFIDTVSITDLVSLKRKISVSKMAKGGWYYQAQNGFIVAQLSQTLFKENYSFF